MCFCVYELIVYCCFIFSCICYFLFFCCRGLFLLPRSLSFGKMRQEGSSTSHAAGRCLGVSSPSWNASAQLVKLCTQFIERQFIETTYLIQLSQDITAWSPHCNVAYSCIHNSLLNFFQVQSPFSSFISIDWWLAGVRTIKTKGQNSSEGRNCEWLWNS